MSFFQQKTTVSMSISTYSEAQWLVCQSYDPAAVDQDKPPPPPQHTHFFHKKLWHTCNMKRTALGTSLLIWDANGHRTPEFMLHSLNSLPEVVLLPPSPIHRKAPSYLHLLSSLSPTTQPPDLILRS